MDTTIITYIYLAIASFIVVYILACYKYHPENGKLDRLYWFLWSFFVGFTWPVTFVVFSIVAVWSCLFET